MGGSMGVSPSGGSMGGSMRDFRDRRPLVYGQSTAELGGSVSTGESIGGQSIGDQIPTPPIPTFAIPTSPSLSALLGSLGDEELILPLCQVTRVRRQAKRLYFATVTPIEAPRVQRSLPRGEHLGALSGPAAPPSLAALASAEWQLIAGVNPRSP